MRSGDFTIDNPGTDNDPIEVDEWAREMVGLGMYVWTCTNCGRKTTEVVHEEGDQTICIPCWERFEANEPGR